MIRSVSRNSTEVRRRLLGRPISTIGWAVGLGFLTLAPQIGGRSAPTDLAYAEEAAPADTTDLAHELELLARDLTVPEVSKDYFIDGPKPDLVVVTSTDVHGEIEPCG